MECVSGVRSGVAPLGWRFSRYLLTYTKSCSRSKSYMWMEPHTRPQALPHGAVAAAPAPATRLGKKVLSALLSVYSPQPVSARSESQEW